MRGPEKGVRGLRRAEALAGSAVQGIEEDVLDEEHLRVGAVQLPPPPSAPEVEPVGCAVAGARVAAGVDEGLDQQRPTAVT